jgi:hypothetical protein
LTTWGWVPQATRASSAEAMYRLVGEQIDAAESKTAEFHRMHATALSQISAMKGGVLNLFQKLGVADEESNQLLLGAGVSESNVVALLGLIETKVAGASGRQPPTRTQIHTHTHT